MKYVAICTINFRAFNAHALGALAEVAGAGLNTHLSMILPPLISGMGNKEQVSSV
jgi:hypothetical protein